MNASWNGSGSEHVRIMSASTCSSVIVYSSDVSFIGQLGRITHFHSVSGFTLANLLDTKGVVEYLLLLSDSIERCGDTELWIATGDGWELPILCDPYGVNGQQTHWRLKPPLDCALSLEMLQALDERVRLLKVPVASDHVIVKHEDLSKIARKAGGITPAYYILWSGIRPGLGEVEPEQFLRVDDKVPSDRAFLDWLFRRTQVAPHATMLLVWKAICQHGAEYLIQRQKPIDFHFVKIAPIPYRPNWRNIMAARFPMAYAMLAGNDHTMAHKERLQMKTGFLAELFNTMLAAFRPKDGWLNWTLEAIPTHEWYYRNAAEERKRYVRLGPVRYADYWRRTIKRMLPHILESFRAWLKGNSLPCAQPDEGPLFGGRRLVGWIPRGRIKPSKPLAAMDSVVVDTDWTALKGPPGEGKVSKKNGEVLELPDLLPEPRLLRIGDAKSQQ